MSGTIGTTANRAIDPAAKVNMLRSLLAESRPSEFYKDIEFVSLVLDLPHDLGPSAKVTSIAFLEEMLACRPEVFNLGAEWSLSVLPDLARSRRLRQPRHRFCYHREQKDRSGRRSASSFAHHRDRGRDRDAGAGCGCCTTLCRNDADHSPQGLAARRRTGSGCCPIFRGRHPPPCRRRC